MSLQFHKRQERDLLDQKKEKEETLLLEMVSLNLRDHLHSKLLSVLFKRSLLFRQEQLERQQSEGKLNSEKHTERKREKNSLI